MKWEYKMVLYDFYKPDSVIDKITLLGENGWELVAAVKSDSNGSVTLYFKRPKAKAT